MEIKIRVFEGNPNFDELRKIGVPSSELHYVVTKQQLQEVLTKKRGGIDVDLKNSKNCKGCGGGKVL